jgi:hypothetical protein
VLVNRENEAKFAALSRDDRLRAIYNTGMSILLKQGYTLSPPVNAGPAELRRERLTAHLYKSDHSTEYNIYMFARPAIDKKLATTSNWLGIYLLLLEPRN